MGKVTWIECPHCGGTGIETDDDDNDVDCIACDGKGVVVESEEPDEPTEEQPQ
jgi:DnaJ-class molecular chaperone